MEVKISNINYELGNFRTSMENLFDRVFSKKLVIGEDVKRFCKTKLGIDEVYKTYGFNKFDLNNPRYQKPDEDVTDIQIRSAKKTLDGYEKKSSIDLVITAGDNPSNITPGPGVDLFRELYMDENVRYIPLHGTACSALCESVKIAGEHMEAGGGDVLFSVINNYTPMFFHRLKQIDTPISMETKANLYYLIYASIFSDGAGSAIFTKEKVDAPHVGIDTSMISLRRDSFGRGEYWLRYGHSDDGLTFDMYLDNNILKEMLSNLPKRNISDLRQMFPEESKSVKCYNLHTAGKPLVDLVAESSDIPPEMLTLTYELMRETGNTGAISTLQGLKETIERGALCDQDYGLIHDFAWGGAASAIYKLHMR